MKNMFEIPSIILDELEKIKKALAPQPELVTLSHHNTILGCSGCSGSCEGSCSGSCSGDCAGGSGGSCGIF